jgi:hypothetical protein
MEFLTITAAVLVGTLLKEVAVATFVTFSQRKARKARYAQLVAMRDQYQQELSNTAKEA